MVMHRIRVPYASMSLGLGTLLFDSKLGCFRPYLVTKVEKFTVTPRRHIHTKTSLDHFCLYVWQSVHVFLYYPKHAGPVVLQLAPMQIHQ